MCIFKLYPINEDVFSANKRRVMRDWGVALSLKLALTSRSVRNRLFSDHGSEFRLY